MSLYEISLHIAGMDAMYSYDSKMILGGIPWGNQQNQLCFIFAQKTMFLIVKIYFGNAAYFNHRAKCLEMFLVTIVIVM